MTRTVVVALVVLIACVGLLRPAAASGPFLPDVEFYSNSGQSPDGDLPYFHGRLGILRPTFTENRLYAAYRILSGNGFSDDQARQLLASCCDIARPYATPGIEQPWLDARAAVTKDPARIDPFRPVGAFEEALNCFPSAFTTAAATLKARIATHGAADPAVVDWVKGQDAVFANCNRKSLALPASAPDAAPEWLKADRAYQIAAAYFYRGDNAEARTRFLAIAADKDSPWAPLTPYLAARASVRAAVAAPTPGLIAQAKADIAAAQQAGGNAIGPDDLAKLSSMLAFQTPGERIQTLEQQLLAPTLPVGLAEAVHDFKLLADAKNAPATDLGDWIHAMEEDASNQADSRAIVLRHWQQTRTVPWLIAALVYLGPEDAQVDAAIAQSRKLAPASPGYETAAWQRIRLMIGQGKSDGARQELDAILDDKNLTIGSRNLFLIERLRVARDWGEFAKFAPRRAEFLGPYFGGGTLDGTDYAALPMKAIGKNYASMLGWRSELLKDPRYLARDGAAILNIDTPLATLARFALASDMPANIRRDLALAAFTRAVLLGRDDLAGQLAAKLAADYPNYAADWQRYLDAKESDERHFAAAMLLLRFPAAEPWIEDKLGYTYKRDVIGSYAQRWWSPQSLTMDVDLANRYFATPCQDACAMPGWLGPALFVPAGDRAEAQRELAQIQKEASAADYLGGIVLGWGKAHPDDPRVPEALHLVVRLTQYGDAGDSGISRRAYDRLRAAYPTSVWTKKTPYWYGK